MTRPAIDLSNKHYDAYNAQAAQYTTNPIIDGYFPKHKTYKELAISRVNRSLCLTLTAFILISAVSYYFVTASEMTLNQYRKQTLSLNDENVELQNKLDYLKSYYNVDKAMQKKNLLHKAKSVIEVNQTAAGGANKVAAAKETQKPFKWSLGY